MTNTTSENLRSDERYASSGMRVWQKVEALEGLSFAWQLVAFVAVFIAVFSRLPGALLHPQFFAEDGWVWYQQAYNLHWLRSLGIAQAGYLGTLPRLVAGLTLLFPMRWAPLIMNLAGTVIQVLPVTALLSRRCTSWGPLPVRMLMAALYIAIPDAPEIHVVLTNAMWHLALLQVLLAFSVPPLSWRGRMSDLILFGIGGISGPFCILLLPAVAAYWWFRRQRWTLVVLGVMSLGALIQVVSILHAVKRPGASLGVTPLRLLRIVAGSIFIDSTVGTGGPNLAIPLLILAAIGGLVILYFGWRNAPLPVRLYFRLRPSGSHGVFARSSPAAGQHSSLGGTRECRWDPLLVFSFPDVSVVCRVVCVKGASQGTSLCRDGCSAALNGWRPSEMDLPVMARESL